MAGPANTGGSNDSTPDRVSGRGCVFPPGGGWHRCCPASPLQRFWLASLSPALSSFRRSEEPLPSLVAPSTSPKGRFRRGAPSASPKGRFRRWLLLPLPRRVASVAGCSFRRSEEPLPSLVAPSAAPKSRFRRGLPGRPPGGCLPGWRCHLPGGSCHRRAVRAFRAVAGDFRDVGSSHHCEQALRTALSTDSPSLVEVVIGLALATRPPGSFLA